MVSVDVVLVAVVSVVVGSVPPVLQPPTGQGDLALDVLPPAAGDPELISKKH